jgi:hypothetical protein
VCLLGLKAFIAVVLQMCASWVCSKEIVGVWI